MFNNTSSTKSVTKKLKLKQKGFSLIELLVVIVILGIISAIAVPNLIASRRAANEAAAIANTRNFYNAQLAYFSVNDAYAQKVGILAVREFLDNRFGKTDSVTSASFGGYRYHISTLTDDPDPRKSRTIGYTFHVHPTVGNPNNPLRTGNRGFLLDSADGGTIKVYTGPDPRSFNTSSSNFIPLQ